MGKRGREEAPVLYSQIEKGLAAYRHKITREEKTLCGSDTRRGERGGTVESRYTEDN